METVKKRNLFLLTFGRVVSLFGTGVQSIAMPLYILEVTGKASMMGLFSMTILLPSLLFAPFAGVLGDRFNRRGLMMLTDCVRFLLLACLAVLTALNLLFLYLIFIFQVFISISDSIFNSSSDGILPDLVSANSLHKAQAAKSGGDAFSMVLGPVAGGVIFGIAGILPVFIINALSFAISGVLEFFIKYQKTTEDTEKLTVPTFLNKIGDTVKFIWSKIGIRQLFIMGTILYFLLYPLFDVVFPYVVKKTIGFSSTQLGLLFAFLMLGVLIGNIVTSALFNRTSTKKLMRIGFTIEILLILFVGASILPGVMVFLGGASLHFFAILCVFLFMIGFFSTWVLMPVNVNLQKMVPNEMRSRFYSILGLFSNAAVPVGAMVYGLLLDSVDSYFIVFGVGVTFAVLAINFLFRAKEEVYNPASEYESKK